MTKASSASEKRQKSGGNGILRLLTFSAMPILVD